MAASPANCVSWWQNIKQLFTVSLPTDIFDSVNKGIVGKLEAEQIRFILPNKIEIENLSVLDENGQPVLAGKHIELSLSLLSLLTNNIVITDAFVDEPFFRYDVKNSVHNVVQIFQTPGKSTDREKGGKIRVTIAKVHVTNGTFQMSHDADVEIFAEGIEAAGNFWVESGPFGVDIDNVTIARGGIFTNGLDFPIANLHGQKLWISDENVSVKNLDAIYDSAVLTGAGLVDIVRDQYSITAHLRAPPNTWPAGLTKMPFDIPAFFADVSLSGPLSDPQILARVDHGNFKVSGIPIEKGTISALVNQNMVQIESSQIHLKPSGIVRASGLYNIDENSYHFAATTQKVMAEHIAHFFEYQKTVSGSIDGQVELIGTNGSRPKVNIKAEGILAQGQLDIFRFPADINFTGACSWELGSNITIQDLKLSDNRAMSASAKGHFSLSESQGHLDFALNLPLLNDYLVDQSKLSVHIKNPRIAGALDLQDEIVNVTSNFHADKIEQQGFQLEGLSGDAKFSDKDLGLQNLSATFYGGHLIGHVIVSDIFKGKSLFGEIEITDAMMNQLPITKRPFLHGLADAKVNLSGSIDKPQLGFQAYSDEYKIGYLGMKKTTILGSYKDNMVVINKVQAAALHGTISGDDIKINLQDQSMQGILKCSKIDWSFVTGYEKIAGELSGNIYLDGTFAKPKIEAALNSIRTVLAGISLGDGRVQMSLLYKRLLNPQDGEALVLGMAAKFAHESSQSKIELSYAPTKDTFNIAAEFDELLFDTATMPIHNDITRSRGKLSGHLIGHGPIAHPVFDLDLSASEYRFSDPRLTSVTDLAQSEAMGPARLKMSLKNERLIADGCVTLGHLSREPCQKDSGLNFEIIGFVNAKSQTIDLNAQFRNESWEQVFAPLKRELIGVGMNGDVVGRITKIKNQPMHHHLILGFDQLRVSLPNIPTMEIDNRAEVTIVDGRYDLNNEVTFNFSTGHLVLGGFFHPDQMHIKSRGTLPLVAARLFVPFVQHARGLASGHLDISGTLQEPILEGSIAIEKGATVNVKKWFEPIEFSLGSVDFHKLSSTSYSAVMKKIDLKIQDGRVGLEGRIVKDYAPSTKKRPNKSSFEISAVGTGVTIRDGKNFLETDFNITTQQSSKEIPTATGEIIITDGFFNRQFDLRNFTATAMRDTSSSAIPSLMNFDMKLDIGIIMRQFAVSARMINVDINANFTGQLTATGTLAKPKMKGSLTLNDGGVDFPFNNHFDLVGIPIVLNETSERFFDPIIDISATQELMTEDYPMIAQDTVIELSLKGNVENLTLGLRPISGDMKLSQFKIFLLLMSPRMAGETTQNQLESLQKGARNAVLAFSGEVFLRPLTNELAELLQGKTNTRIRFGSALEPGSVSLNLNWVLSPRVEIIGSYTFLTNSALVFEEEQKSMFHYNHYPLGDLKLKLLLFDHKPWGPLFFEGSFGANRYFGGEYEPRGNFLLRYRVYSK